MLWDFNRYFRKGLDRHFNVTLFLRQWLNAMEAAGGSEVLRRRENPSEAWVLCTALTPRQYLISLLSFIKLYKMKFYAYLFGLITHMDFHKKSNIRWFLSSQMPLFLKVCRWGWVVWNPSLNWWWPATCKDFFFLHWMFVSSLATKRCLNSCWHKKTCSELL